MGLSETVLAAMIGAAATIGTALFQLVHNWRAQAGDRRTKRGGFRSLVILVVIMLACAVAGYAFSEYRTQNLRDETHALRQELQQQVRILEASTARLEQVKLSRAENSQQAWSESRLAMGQEAGGARFVDPPVERTHTDTTKEVCSAYTHWSSDKAHTARIVVKYVM